MKRSCKCAIDSECHNNGRAECLVGEQLSGNLTDFLNKRNDPHPAKLSDAQLLLVSQQPEMSNGCDDVFKRHVVINNNTRIDKTIVFSDKIGVGLSSIINNHTAHTVVNHCMPGATLSHIVDCICSARIENNTNIVLFVGNSYKLNIKEIKNSFAKLNNVNCKKITLCALPYSSSLNKNENNKIYALNKLLHHLISRHSDKFSWFDCNMFIKHFKITKDDMYLAKRCKHNIATLLANTINISFNNCVSNRLSTGAQANSFLVK
jgi:hypothetical protein